MRKVKMMFLLLCGFLIITVVAPMHKVSASNNTRTIKVTLKWNGPRENIIIGFKEKGGQRFAGSYLDFGNTLPGYPDNWDYDEKIMPKFNQNGKLIQYELNVGYSQPKYQRLGKYDDKEPNYRITGDMDKGFVVTIINNQYKDEWMYDGVHEMYKYNGNYVKNSWKHIDGKWYYFDADGYLVLGKWISTGGKWYYVGDGGYYGQVETRGVMYADAFTPDGYYVNSSGEWVKGSRWIKDHVGWWLKYDDGSYAKNQWVSFGNRWYYLKSSGYMAANEWIGKYHVNSSGQWDY